MRGLTPDQSPAIYDSAIRGTTRELPIAKLFLAREFGAALIGRGIQDQHLWDQVSSGAAPAIPFAKDPPGAGPVYGFLRIKDDGTLQLGVKFAGDVGEKVTRIRLEPPTDSGVPIQCDELLKLKDGLPHPDRYSELCS